MESRHVIVSVKVFLVWIYEKKYLDEFLIAFFIVISFISFLAKSNLLAKSKLLLFREILFSCLREIKCSWSILHVTWFIHSKMENIKSQKYKLKYLFNRMITPGTNLLNCRRLLYMHIHHQLKLEVVVLNHTNKLVSRKNLKNQGNKFSETN